MLIAGKYEVLKELGRGAFGVVHEAVDQILERTVAIKTIHDAGFSSDNAKQNFEKKHKVIAYVARH